VCHGSNARSTTMRKERNQRSTAGEKDKGKDTEGSRGVAHIFTADTHVGVVD
jgi:hypothetical protein